MRTTKNVELPALILLLFLGAACGRAKEDGAGTGGAGGGPAGGAGGGPAGGVGGGPTGGMGGGPGNLLCTNLLVRTDPNLPPGKPARCCPRPRPDCRDKPDGFTEPGETGPCVDAEPGGSSTCACGCSSGQWFCGC
jgi:hypothetical protein